MTVHSAPATSAADVLERPPMRKQTQCNLVVRLEWKVAEGHHHPQHTYICVQDVEMAAVVVARAAEYAPRAIQLVGASTSPNGGKHGDWDPLGLEISDDRSTGWLSGACA